MLQRPLSARLSACACALVCGPRRRRRFPDAADHAGGAVSGRRHRRPAVPLRRARRRARRSASRWWSRTGPAAPAAASAWSRCCARRRTATRCCARRSSATASRIWCSPRRRSIRGRSSRSACSRPIRWSSSRAQDLPANNLAEFIAYAKATGKVNYGNQGVANTGHLLGELMELKGDFKMTAVFYRGSAPAINDLLAGTIDMVPDYLLANKGNIDAGKIKMIAVADDQAAEGLSERADHDGDHAGRHLDHLDGGVGAARHAEGDHQEDLGRDRRRASSSPTCRSASSSSRPTRSAARRSGCAR